MTFPLHSLESLLAEVDAYLGNPFEAGPDRHATEALVRRAWPQVSPTIDALAKNGRTQEARRFILGVGALQLRVQQATLLDDTLVPARVLEKLTLARPTLRKLLLAAERCRLALERFVGDSPPMRRLRAQTWRACFGPSLDDALRLGHVIREQNVLILGETGTGKELLAEAIQAAAPGDDHGLAAPQQTLNAAAIPAELVESELFGHVRGAFSDAVKHRVGKIVAAHQGTLFLDEIGDLPPAVQPKLLRAIETNRITPVGSNDEVTVEVRYLAATARPLRQMVERGEFRADLYQRLSGAVLTIAPLRERLEDLRPIALAILGRLADKRTQITGNNDVGWVQKVRLALEEALDGELATYGWPGNVRELENVIRARLLGLDATTPGTSPPPRASYDEQTQHVLAGDVALDEAIAWYVQRVTTLCDGNQTQAARRLDIDRGTLARYLKRS